MFLHFRFIEEDLVACIEWTHPQDFVRRNQFHEWPSPSYPEESAQLYRTRPPSSLRVQSRLLLLRHQARGFSISAAIGAGDADAGLSDAERHMKGIARLLRRKRVGPSQLFSHMDASHSSRISPLEFARGFAAVGVNLSTSEVWRPLCCLASLCPAS